MRNLHNNRLYSGSIRLIVFGFITFVTASFSGFSQERMSLYDCLNRSFQRSKDAAMVKVKRSSADSYLKQERDLFLPSLSITNQHNL